MKTESFAVKGIINKKLVGDKFLVDVKTEKGDIQVRAYISGRIKQSKISLTSGDKVEVEISCYDITQGRISKRL